MGTVARTVLGAAACLIAGCNVVFAVDDLAFDAGGAVSTTTSGAGGGAACDDGIRNHGESGVDCGGPCPPCTGPQKPLGAACGDDTECASGFCPEDDGVCCDSPCALACEACQADKTGGTEGVCDFVLAGTDPEAECTPSEAWTCGNSMGCSGTLTACALWPRGTECGSPFCSGGFEHGVSQCDGLGDCDTPPGSSCGAYVCGATACLDSCGNYLDCGGAYYCSAGSCVADLPTGAACSGDSADYECQCGDCTLNGLCCL
jgi:hypothetical protein